MASMPSHTAILVFTRNATTEARYKRFQKHISFQQNRAIATALIKKTIVSVEATNLPYFIIDDALQQGLTFGERITKAAISIFEKGFENLIIIGNDTPRLCAKCITTTASLLATKEVVIGPSTDGGVYLIGLQRSVFQAPTFQKLPWLSANLVDALLRYGKVVYQLPSKADIDTPTDFTKYLQASPISVFFIIRILLGQVHQLVLFNANILSVSSLLPSFGLRAPPMPIVSY